MRCKVIRPEDPVQLLLVFSVVFGEKLEQVFVSDDPVDIIDDDFAVVRSD